MKKPIDRTDATDWGKLASMSDEEAEISAASDPENRPLTAAQLSSAKSMPRVQVIRRSLQLTQEEFSARYQIPLGTLRDWEQERSEPDQPAKAYLKVIAANPVGTAEALIKGAA